MTATPANAQETVSPQLATLGFLRAFCRERRFAPGEVLRQKGQHYSDMHLISDGSVVVDRDPGGSSPALSVSGAGSPIGEMAFLRGSAATATVTAKSAVSTLLIDHATLARLEREQPALAAQLSRQLAETARKRSNANLVFAVSARSFIIAPNIEIYLCHNQEMLERAQRLRYKVYCEELGRQSPNADHQAKIIADDLDRSGHTFLAVKDGGTIGTLRLNFASEGSLGVLEELYGMTKSPLHPAHTGVCTKFIIEKSSRGSPASIKLMSAVARFARGTHQSQQCFIDCIPALLPYYKAMGFTVAGEKFFHRENGPSHPMTLDLEHIESLCKEPTRRDYLLLIAKLLVIKMLHRVRMVLSARAHG